MSEFFQKVGLDWQLLLSQAANFLILVLILRTVAYKPIVKILNDRKQKIAEGLTKAEEAARKLSDAQNTAREKIREAEGRAVTILKDAETKGKQTEAHLLELAHKKEADILKTAELAAEGRADEAAKRVREEAAVLVKEAIQKTVELDPKAIDEALVKKAIASIQ